MTELKIIETAELNGELFHVYSDNNQLFFKGVELARIFGVGKLSDSIRLLDSKYTAKFGEGHNTGNRAPWYVNELGLNKLLTKRRSKELSMFRSKISELRNNIKSRNATAHEEKTTANTSSQSFSLPSNVIKMYVALNNIIDAAQDISNEDNNFCFDDFLVSLKETHVKLSDYVTFLVANSDIYKSEFALTTN